MKRGFYRKFAADCIRKNRQNYIPYLLTCTLMVTVFFIIQSMLNNSGLSHTFGGSGITLMLQIGNRIMVLFSAIFLFYTNSFLIKQRRHEFGLYNVLGLEKRHITKIIFHETLIAAGSSLLFGILAGMLLYKLAYAALMRLMQAEVPLGFEVSGQAILYTVLLFSVIHLILFLNAFRQVRFSNTIALLQSSQTGEKEPRSKWLLTMLGIVCLALGYGLSIYITNPVGAFALFFLAVLFVIIGTYCLFTAGSIIWLKAMRRKKSYYYQPSHFINISGMLYRMKQNAVSLANICILSTMVIIAISTTLSLYLGCEDNLYQQYPRQISGRFTLSGTVYDEDTFSETEQTLKNIAKQEGVTFTDELSVTALSFSAVEEGSSFSTDNQRDTSILTDMNRICTLTFMPLEEYNQLNGSEETLAKNEILIYGPETYQHEDLSLLGVTYQVKEKLSDYPAREAFTGLENNRSFFIVLDSIETFQALHLAEQKAYGQNASQIEHFYGFDLSDPSKSQTMIDQFDAAFASQKGSFIREHNTDPTHPENMLSATLFDRNAKRGDFIGLYAGLFFTGIFMSIIFLIATILIIYYKQISEGLQDARRFQIMQNIGLSRAEIKKSIHAQVLTVFFLPLIVAGIHAVFAFPITSRMLKVLAMSNVHSFFLCLLGTFAVFAAGYIIIYLITAKKYYKIVSQ